jgi:hypothetical protein
MSTPSGPAASDPEIARAVAARVGLPGVPISMRTAADAPRGGIGTGHWLRRTQRLAAAVERARAAVAATPPGGVRDQLSRLQHVLGLRAAQYTRIATVGQALLPDDDVTDADGTAPGEQPPLAGAAKEIDERLVAGLAHLTAVAEATEAIALAAAGRRDPESVAHHVSELFVNLPPA